LAQLVSRVLPSMRAGLLVLDVRVSRGAESVRAGVVAGAAASLGLTAIARSNGRRSRPRIVSLSCGSPARIRTGGTSGSSASASASGSASRGRRCARYRRDQGAGLGAESRHNRYTPTRQARSARLADVGDSGDQRRIDHRRSGTEPYRGCQRVGCVNSICLQSGRFHDPLSSVPQEGDRWTADGPLALRTQRTDSPSVSVGPKIEEADSSLDVALDHAQTTAARSSATSA
jgi:hypothetical protein